MITRATLSTIEQGLPKYRSMLAGNTAFSPNKFESIASTILSSSTSSYTFTSIPQTFYALEIRYMGRVTGTGTGNLSCRITLNGDNTNYWWNYVGGSNTSAGAGTSSVVQSYLQIDNTTVAGGLASGVYGLGIITLPQYASTSVGKTAIALSGTAVPGTVIFNARASGLFYNSNNAITSITLTPENNDWAVGSMFALYGVMNT